MTEYITIGKIPENCKSLIIYCGDYSSDETIEYTFSIKKNNILGIDNDFSCEFEEEIFKPNSKVLTKISNYIKTFGIELSTNSIYNGIKLLIDKKDYLSSQKWRIIDSEGGIIQNEKFQYNGNYYLRRSLEKDDNFIDENICVKII